MARLLQQFVVAGAIGCQLASPAHIGEFARGLLDRMAVRDAARKKPVSVIAENMPFQALDKAVTSSTESSFPVVDRAGKMTGILSITDIREVLFDDNLRELVVASDVVTSEVARVRPGDSLETARNIMSRLQIDELPVMSQDRPDEIETMLSKQDIVNYYHECCLV